MERLISLPSVLVKDPESSEVRLQRPVSLAWVGVGEGMDVDAGSFLVWAR